MKNSKFTRFFVSGCFLAAILLAGCFNPITVIPPKSGNPVTDPFTIDILIGKDGSARSVAGPDSTRIKGDNIHGCSYRCGECDNLGVYRELHGGDNEDRDGRVCTVQAGIRAV